MPKPCVLIVDDEVDMCEALSEYLTRDDFLVSTAIDGESALQIVRGKPIDVVLLDIKMPGIDGVKVLQELKKIDNNIKVVVITAYGDENVSEAVKRLGAYGHIRKPFNTAEIKKIIEEALKVAQDERE